MTKKIYSLIWKRIEMTLNISKPLNTHEKLIRHILHPPKPYNFCIKQFFIRRTIQKLFEMCKLGESPCIIFQI